MSARTRLFEWSGGGGGSVRNDKSERSASGEGYNEGIKGEVREGVQEAVNEGIQIENNEDGNVRVNEEGNKEERNGEMSEEGGDEGKDLSELFATESERWSHVAASTATVQCTQAVRKRHLILNHYPTLSPFNPPFHCYSFH